MRFRVPAYVWVALPLGLLSGALVGALVAHVATAPAPAGAAAPAGRTPRAGAPPAGRRAARPPATFTLVAGGDVALRDAPKRSVLAGVRRFLEPADLAIANLEGTLATAGTPRCLAGSSGCYVFRGAPGWAAELARSGLTDLNVANNHALDYGAEGQAETLAALRSARLAYDGLPGQITYVRAGGVHVAVIGCAPYPWAQSLLDVTGTQALVREAAQSAQVVIVYMHAGAEGARAEHVADRMETYLGERRGNPVEFAHAMIDAGADLVFASGPHILRGMQWYRGRLIAYSLGDLAGEGTLSTAGVLAESALLRVRLDARGRFVSGRLIPLRLDGYGAPALDPARSSLDLVRTLSREDFPRSGARVSATGTLAPPPGWG